MSEGTLGERIWEQLLGGGFTDADYFFKVLRRDDTSDEVFTGIVETLYLMTMNVTVHLHTKVSNCIDLGDMCVRM